MSRLRTKSEINPQGIDYAPVNCYSSLVDNEVSDPDERGRLRATDVVCRPPIT